MSDDNRLKGFSIPLCAANDRGRGSASVWPQPLLWLLLILLLVPCEVSAAWQTTWFEVLVARPNPNGRALESAEDAVRRLAVDQAEILKMENFLHDVAVEFEKMGFADPVASGHLGPVVGELLGDRNRIRVYLLDIPAWNNAYSADQVGLAFYLSGVCDTTDYGGSILVHQPSAFTGGRITDGTYQSLAHELFHAVQSASSFRQGSEACGLGKWITEGTADAIAFDMGRKLRGLEYRDYNNTSRAAKFFKLWGGRLYNTPLPEAPSGGDRYYTSSFWRHLAEVTSAKRNGRAHPGSRKAEFDYRYLVDLFAVRPSGVGTTAELKWVSDWIKGYPFILEDLSRVYAQFTTSAADYMGEGMRITLSARNGGQRWRNRLFGECKELRLSKVTPGDSVVLPLKKAAALCVQVDVAGLEGPIELAFQELSLPRNHQEQLRLGAVGGELVGSPFVSDCELPGRTLPSCSLWRLPGTGEATHIFVISNMAGEAETTADVEARLHVSVPSWASTGASDLAPSSGSGSGKQPKTREDMRERAAQLRANPSRNSAMAAQAGVQANEADAGCSGQRRGQNLCGPRIEILLSQTSPAYAGPGYVGGAGGMLNQLGGVGYSDEEGPTTLADLQEQVSFSAGRAVSIVIPRVPYGSTDGFSNALIAVPDGRGNSNESVDRSPDEKGEFLPNGTVAIIEYTPHILRGTYSGRLVSHEDMMNYDPAEGPLTVVGEAEGSFNVAAPWRGTGSKPDFEDDSLMREDVAQDMITILQRMPPEARQLALVGDSLQKLCELGISSSQLEALGVSGGCGGQAGGSVVEQGCSCTCADYLSEANVPECQTQCTTGWEQRECVVSASPETAPRDAETERFEAELREWSQMTRYPLQENVIASRVYVFQISASGQRQELWAELEAAKQQLTEQQQEEAAAAARLQDMPVDGLDAETLRYKAAVEQLNLPSDVIEDLVEMFQANDATMRAVLWQRVEQAR